MGKKMPAIDEAAEKRRKAKTWAAVAAVGAGLLAVGRVAVKVITAGRVG